MMKKGVVSSRWSVALFLAFVWITANARWSGSKFAVSPSRISLAKASTFLRAGSNDAIDEERYSRQVYTLGARAHGLVRSCTILLDGPPTSGLMFECAKDLALSGVGTIVVVISDDSDHDGIYHDASLDDLGRAYCRAARNEIAGADEEDDVELFIEFLRRLNPSLEVSSMSRGELASIDNSHNNIVLVAIDRPQSTQLDLNEACRKKRIAFVAVETAGVYGKAFCDFGPSFQVVDPDGETPLVVPLDRIEVVKSEDTNDQGLLMVYCVEGERHDVSKGDPIQFQFSSGAVLEQCCVVEKVEGPTKFSVTCPALNSTGMPLQEYVELVNKDVASFSRQKVPQALEYLPMTEALEQAADGDSAATLFAACDLDKSFDPVRRSALLNCFQTLHRLLSSVESTESTSFFEMVKAVAKERTDHCRSDPAWKTIVNSFGRCARGKVVPIQAIMGAIGAQEALKAVSGLYMPIRQFLLYDCDELLVEREVEHLEPQSGLGYVLGKPLCERLSEQKLFVVGCGAIGCEILKNLAAMDAATRTKGCIVATDMDTIEKSNLSRQLLFRDSDIGKFKSVAAHEAVLRFNSKVKIDAHTSKVGEDEQGPFNDSFWSKGIDVILNALDNVEARLYMDGQCVAHEKALVDAGTLGSKGNVQVVVPHQSESYGSSVDPPEPAIPVCTLKNFPYAISHTIQWARDLFEGYYERRPKQANTYGAMIQSDGPTQVAAEMKHDLGDEAAFQAALELQDDLSVGDPKELSLQELRTTTIRWAIKEAETLFHRNVEDLLKEHPVDSLDEDGEPFWSGTRRVPTSLSYHSTTITAQQESINQNLVEFVRAAARLRLETLLPPFCDPESSFVSEDEALSALVDGVCGEHSREEETVEGYLQLIRQNATPEYSQLEFEKDDETNGHVAFVTAASNLRALCFGIAPVDAMETRRVAGRIVPAMITTTAFVSALSCVELLKLLQKAPLFKHRNAFINLALPFFAFTAPLPAEELPGLRGSCYTQWDRITIKETKKAATAGGMTLRNLLSKIKKQIRSKLNEVDADDAFSVSSVSFGPFLVFANFLHEDDKALLKRPLWDVLEDAIVENDEFAGRDADENASDKALESLRKKTFVDLTVVVEDLEADEEVELPPVRVQKRIDKI